MKRKIRARDPKTIVVRVRLGKHNDAKLTALARLVARGNKSEAIRRAIQFMLQAITRKE